MYIFNKITVNPQLPKQIEKLGVISENLWWSWNTEFLKIFKEIDIDLWERCGKNPVKFLKQVEQEKLEKAVQNQDILTAYKKNVENFENYMQSKNTWFNKKYPENKDDIISYFSAEYGLDETLPIYSGGLGILSGDHLKSASDLGIPLVAIGLLYKNGYFNQVIDKHGNQLSEYNNIDLENLPIKPVKDKNGEDLIINIQMLEERLYIKVWKICVGRVNLYLLDTDIEENNENFRGITLKLYGGDQEMRIRQEMVLGIGGVKLLEELGINPTVYHMNEGHSSFLVLETIKNTIKEKQLSFNIARDIITAKTVFTTHTPVPAGNDIFEIGLVEKYFNNLKTKLCNYLIENNISSYLDLLNTDTTGFTKEELAQHNQHKKNIYNIFNKGLSGDDTIVADYLNADVYDLILAGEKGNDTYIIGERAYKGGTKDYATTYNVIRDTAGKNDTLIMETVTQEDITLIFDINLKTKKGKVLTDNLGNAKYSTTGSLISLASIGIYDSLLCLYSSPFGIFLSLFFLPKSPRLCLSLICSIALSNSSSETSPIIR